jgi:Uma2 family endonuclease
MRTTLDVDHLVTAEEFEQIQDGDHRWELVAGRVIKMSPPGARHGVIAVRLAEFLGYHVRTTGLGFVMGEAGYRLASNPDTVRGPDLSFVRKDRVPASGIPEGFWPGAPDLVIEILSPDNHPRQVREKTATYFALGSQVVWVVDPRRKQVSVHDVHGDVRIMGIGDTLEGGTLLPGFLCAVDSIFAGLG